MSSRPAAKAPRSRAESRQETREALLAAGLELFAGQGFDAPSLDAICARAGLTRGAFYVHFEDRDALIVAVVDRVVARFLDAVIAGGAADAPGLEATVGRFARAVALAAPGASEPGADEPLVRAGLLPLHRLLEAASRSPAIRERLVQLAVRARDRVAAAVTAACAAGVARDDVEPPEVASVLVATAIGVLAGAEVGVPLELEALRATVGRLLAPISGRAAAGTPRPPRRRRA